MIVFLLRLLTWLLLVFVFGGEHSVRAMCPFCPPASVTLTQQVDESQAALLASLVKTTQAKSQAEPEAASTFEVISLLKNFRGAIKKGAEITVSESVAGEPGDLFLLLAKTEGRDSDILAWDPPRPISEIGFQYIKQAPVPESPRENRLRYFLKFLEYPDPLLADDAYSEFTGADYPDLMLIKDAFSPEKLRKWINDPKTLASRLGLYGLMLGLVGNQEDAKLLEAKIRDEADKTRLGIDGIIGGYLLLTREKGMDVLEESKIQNPRAPVADIYAVMSAFRFLWRYEPGLIPKDRLKAAVRMLLDRPEVADMAIADLARWKDWSVQDRLMEIYKTGDPGNPLGEISIRQAVIRYLIAGTLDQPKNAHPPPHAVKARKHLEAIRKMDPKAVQRAERLMLPRSAPPEIPMIKSQ